MSFFYLTKKSWLYMVSSPSQRNKKFHDEESWPIRMMESMHHHYNILHLFNSLWLGLGSNQLFYQKVVEEMPKELRSTPSSTSMKQSWNLVLQQMTHPNFLLRTWTKQQCQRFCPSPKKELGVGHLYDNHQMTHPNFLFGFLRVLKRRVICMT